MFEFNIECIDMANHSFVELIAAENFSKINSPSNIKRKISEWNGNGKYPFAWKLLGEFWEKNNLALTTNGSR